MKKLLSLFVMLLLPLMASAANYQEGTHYTVVSEQVTKKPEVREFFSFYCPHCFRFEPFMAGVKKQLPTGVNFEFNHVDFLRGASPVMQQMLSKALVVAEELGMERKLMGALFNYIHVQRAVFTSEKDIRNVFVLNGADGEKFDKLMKSFGVNSKVKQMKKKQDYYAKSGGLTGVPTVIVNGRYKIDNASLDKKNLEADYNNLVKYLLTLD
ncbi:MULTISPECIES: thiol:disulfide interchange protein DsbA/DsbL [unclassified Colwellia]|uniref:thiol:disulfide interchange protein DsbA/DsbL n=1 Tax=unclassified Colwellia TaxID=196834 RepID=UPI0015F7577E|nr:MULTISPECIES: thiol:disulfide interchange protein DsbA/DsbL [unclassified Colwellia]MBA6234401.1 thiol:disulfide interchange protein DsbA/DsbL [Colwellia sp. MB02u-7]MBA6236822.1 thiol:disulfide interchange protein DsbA/DsbL [Colwellia sp. MB02u-11]MBA6256236.1 thiol:disulfide interchange protein DsbA/DsbL [Colwellia sp. MB3u-28]MBA6260120.1 thiol:disulfide interchange protein DsbA/DsbL [Colwellia sp. MB3u-41]MBA6300038.1 thiol:disulfide interchange protein DsbA/DsbL [Colwellia sp. MB3u-22]